MKRLKLNVCSCYLSWLAWVGRTAWAIILNMGHNQYNTQLPSFTLRQPVIGDVCLYRKGPVKSTESCKLHCVTLMPDKWRLGLLLRQDLLKYF